MDKELKFTIKVNGQDVFLKAVKPTHKQRLESDKVKNTVFRQCVQSGAYLMTELDNELKKRGFWDEDRDAKIKELQDFVRNGVKRLNEGGFDIDEAKKLALEISTKRVELMSLSTIRADFIDKTAEGQANNAAFDYLVSQCVVYNEGGKPYFSSYEDYIARKGDEDAIECASKLYELLYNRINDDTIINLPENQFLREYGFVDEKMRPVNEQGKLVDDEGRLIDEDGNWINDKGEKVDFFGNLLDKDGKPIIKRKPFTKNGVEVKKGAEVVNKVDEKVEVVETIKVVEAT